MLLCDQAGLKECLGRFRGELGQFTVGGDGELRVVSERRRLRFAAQRTAQGVKRGEKLSRRLRAPDRHIEALDGFAIAPFSREIIRHPQAISRCER